MTLMTSNIPGISAFPDSDNLMTWIGTIEGAEGTVRRWILMFQVYHKLIYKLSLKFPANYPFNPPNVKFETPIFHPNVDHNGSICLDILKEKWSAIYNVQTILLSIQSLLGEPNNDSPLNNEAASLWNNQKEYKIVLLKKYNGINI